MAGDDNLATQLAAFREALFGRLVPLWLERGWDVARGGFFDRLDREYRPVPLPAKRLLVQCRQIFTLCRARVLAPELDVAPTAQRAFAFLIERYWDKAQGGWFFSLAADGGPCDARKDLSGHAFALFALAHYYETFGEKAALERAAATLDLLETRLAASNGGFFEGADAGWQVAPGPRRQNPHMHLLEAFLALFEATHEPRYRDASTAMIELLERHFVDPASGTLGEHFDAAWRPDPASGDIIEPGHHFEWYWLLCRAASLFSQAPHPLADRLFVWADRHGIDEDKGGVFDQLGRDGAVLQSTKRLWPQAEAVRAYAIHGQNQERLAAIAAFLVERYLDPKRGFAEHLDRDGALIIDELYGSTPYHLVGAFEALARAE